MTFGAVAASRRRTIAPANVITNGTFTTSTGWDASIGYSGKTISGGKANMSSTPAYDGFNIAITVTAGKYYELTWTVSGYSTGNASPYMSGGTARNGVSRTANGTYTERLLANTGNNNFGWYSADVIGTYSVDNITLIGPYDTSTVGGA